MTNDKFRMTNGEQEPARKRMKRWPGMPTAGSQLAESLLVVIPGIVVIIALLLLSVVAILRHMLVH